ncbi:MAG: RRXRR domain-containing protein [Crocosphaera sp.]
MHSRAHSVKNHLYSAYRSYRGQLIKESLTKRAGFRRSRRTRKLRYRLDCAV